MKAVHVLPPYVLIAHSYGGIVSRTFLERYPDAVAGMVLADTASELLYQGFQPGILGKAMEVMMDGVDWVEVTTLREESRMSDEE